MKIGILGTRGIPNNYGGFEQLAQYLSTSLVKKGHGVFVYNPHDHPFKENNWNGVTIIHCKNPEKKIGTIGQFLYDRNCINDSQQRNFDVLLHLGYTSDSIWHKRWPKNSVNIVNMDGLEWKRSKYNSLTKEFLKYSELLAVKSADVLIADNPGIQDHLLKRYRKHSHFIPYGAETFSHADENVLKKYNLLPNCYSLVIARMEPENNIEMIISGYDSSVQKDPLLIIGPIANRYGKWLAKKYNEAKIIFAGAIYDKTELDNLRYFSSYYFHGHSCGGTNPSLLEAMACSCTIVAHHNIFNRYVLENDGYYFSSANEVTNILNQIINTDAIKEKKNKNLEKIETFYNWQRIINSYEGAMLSAVNSRR